jgi:hypothetical protein
LPPRVLVAPGNLQLSNTSCKNFYFTDQDCRFDPRGGRTPLISKNILTLAPAIFPAALCDGGAAERDAVDLLTIR